MKRRLLVFAAVSVVLFAAIVALHRHSALKVHSAAKLPAASADRLALLDAYGKLPLAFEQNVGQSDPRVKFLARGAGYTVFLTETNATLRLESHSVSNDSLGKNAVKPDRKSGAVLRFALSNSNPHPALHALDVEPGRTNYFVGNDPRKWRSGVSQYSRVKFDAVYPGIDLMYYGNPGQLESDYIVAPGADAKQIALRVEGADRIHLNSTGDAIISTAAGDVSLHQPHAYQDADGSRQEVAASYIQSAPGVLGIEVGSYDPRQTLVIDPVVGYATFLSGSTSVTYRQCDRRRFQWQRLRRRYHGSYRLSNYFRSVPENVQRAGDGQRLRHEIQFDRNGAHLFDVSRRHWANRTNLTALAQSLSMQAATSTSQAKPRLPISPSPRQTLFRW